MKILMHWWVNAYDMFQSGRNSCICGERKFRDNLPEITVHSMGDIINKTVNINVIEAFRISSELCIKSFLKTPIKNTITDYNVYKPTNGEWLRH